MSMEELFDWCMSGNRLEQEDDDLYDRCVFLIRAVNGTSGSIRRPCRQEDFHYINLVTDSTISEYFPSIVNCVGHGNMLSFRTPQAFQIYILAEPSVSLDEHTHDVDQPNTHDVEQPNHEHTGASVISVTPMGDDWNPFIHPYPRIEASFEAGVVYLNPAVLSDRIYTFGWPILSPRVCCPNTSSNNNTSSNKWDCITLPDDLVDTKASFPVLCDPLEDRIILNLPEKCYLYAFYPATDEWKPLARFIENWVYIAAAIADGIIFFVPDYVSGIHDFVFAFDVKTSTWLDIEWDFGDIRGFVIDYQAIFTLSNKGLMCLASGILNSSVQFLRFRFKRTSDTLKLTAIDYQKHDIPGATRISDIIFLQEPAL